jgi:spore coat protein U-like protein
MTLHFQILLFQEFSHMKFTKIALSTLSAATLGFLALGVASTSALAATNTATNFQVTAAVGTACTVKATNMNFGTVVTTAVNNATSTVTINCTNGDVYSVGLSKGGGVDEANRVMLSGANSMKYALYSDTGRSVNWGTAAGQVAGTGNGSDQPITVYGQIPVQTQPATGNYSDTITVNLTY